MPNIIDTPNNVIAYIPQLKIANIKEVIRYDCRWLSGDWKQVHDDELRALKAAGIKVGIVYEYVAAPSGADNGFADATYSRKMAIGRGQPASSAIYFAVDYDPSLSQIRDQVLPYFSGVAHGLNGQFRMGAYCSGQCAEELRKIYPQILIWITCSRGFAGSTKWKTQRLFDLDQTQCDVKLQGLDVDYDEPKNPGYDWGSFEPWSAPSAPVIVVARPTDTPAPVTAVQHASFWSWLLDRIALASPPKLAPIIEPPKLVPGPSSVELHDYGHRVKRTMQSLNYPWFPDQNVVSVEGADPDGTSNKNRPNAFDDIKMVLDGDGKIIGGPWEGTTQPGVYWTQHPMADGGAFIISKGPQAVWTPGDYHGHTVWRQADGSTIYGTRDPNGTYQRQGPPIAHGNIGVHHHGGYDLPRDNISNAAAGCQVIRSTDEQQDFMDLTMKCPRYLADKDGYRLTATVLEAKDILP